MLASGSSKAGDNGNASSRFRSYSTDNIASSQAAAAKLAAAAGLGPITSRAEEQAAEESNHKRLTKTPLTKKQLREFREILLAKRRELIGDVSDMEAQALTGSGSGSLSHLPQHMADAGSDTYDQSLALDLVASQRKLLGEINDALERIDNRTYGVCELLGKPINIDRLKSTPWARFSIDAARKLERGIYSP